MFLTHLHFDHVEGPRTDVPMACSSPASTPTTGPTKHWQWGVEPNAREKASLSENLLPIAERATPWVPREGRMSKDVLGIQGWDAFLPTATPKAMIPLLHMPDGPPGIYGGLASKHGPHSAGVRHGSDTRPLLTLDEKKTFLDAAANEEWVLFLEHDAINAACTVQHTPKGVRLREAAPSWRELVG